MISADYAAAKAACPCQEVCRLRTPKEEGCLHPPELLPGVLTRHEACRHLPPVTPPALLLGLFNAFYLPQMLLSGSWDVLDVQEGSGEVSVHTEHPLNSTSCLT